MATDDAPAYLIRFPPFPPVPSGAVVVPFSEFKEHGIRVQPGGEDNETEIDALGVPTVALGAIHSTDWCKTETKRQKYNQAGRGAGGRSKKRKTKTTAAGGVTELNWQDYWEEREVSYRRKEGYDPNAEASERFYQGAWDFRNGRPWPLAVKQSGPLYVWGEFLRFAGVPTGPEGSSSTSTTTPAPPPPKPERERTDPDLDSDSDLEGAEEDEDDPNAGVLNVQNLISAEAAMKAQARTEAFLRDPALMLKVFLSSYARDRGIIWTDLNLKGAPTLMRFFINFLIDNNVLPKREMNAIKHESTHRVIDFALKELPITAQLAKVWPDDFSLACRECWESKVEVFVFRPLSPMVEDDDGATGSGAGAGAMGEDGDGGQANWNGWGDNANGNGDEVKADEGVEPVAEGWGDNASAGWKTTGDGWGSKEIITVKDDEPEAEAEAVGKSDEIKIVDVPDPSLTNTNTNSETTAWESLKPTTFFSFLGPTALPLTHTTGIVEASVRRIKAVHPPLSDAAKLPVAKGLSADAVEGCLRRTFGVVVFEPWVNWNKGEEAHLAMPRILSTSRGAVVDNGDGEGQAGGEAVVSSALPPFDPHKDEISVLVDPAHLELFSVGMGCMCTWVQMARVEDLEPQNPKKKKKKNAKMERFWYVEESLRVIPSYYTYLD